MGRSAPNEDDQERQAPEEGRPRDEPQPRCMRRGHAAVFLEACAVGPWWPRRPLDWFRVRASRRMAGPARGSDGRPDREQGEEPPDRPQRDPPAATRCRGSHSVGRRAGGHHHWIGQVPVSSIENSLASGQLPSTEFPLDGQLHRESLTREPDQEPLPGDPCSTQVHRTVPVPLSRSAVSSTGTLIPVPHGCPGRVPEDGSRIVSA